MTRHYIVGIDLGTTHTVVAYAPLDAAGNPEAGQGDIQLFDMAQAIAPVARKGRAKP